MAAFKPLALQYRLGNAVVSYAAYIGQMFWPAGMVVQYVHPGPQLLLSDTLLPAAILLSITLGVAWFAWRRRYLAVGWLWYLGMMVPVIGLVQVGAQARADRYTYLTQIGLYIMIAWGMGDVARLWRSRGSVYAALAAAAVGCWPRSPGHRLRIGKTALRSGNIASPANRRTTSLATLTERPSPVPAGSTRPCSSMSRPSKSILST